MRSRQLAPVSPLLNPRLIFIAALLVGLALISVITYLTPKAGAQNQPVNLNHKQANG